MKLTKGKLCLTIVLMLSVVALLVALLSWQAQNVFAEEMGVIE